MMDPARARLGLKRKDRRSRTTLAHIVHVDGDNEERELDWAQVPGPIIVPSFYEAGALTGRPILAAAPCDYKVIVVTPGRGETLERVASVGVELTANPQVFAQMLAKIALGVAVAKFGLEGFEPLVRDFILTRPDEYGHWVGGFAGVSREEPRVKELHTVRLRGNAGPDGQYVIVNVRLFAEFGGPTNYVVDQAQRRQCRAFRREFSGGVDRLAC